MRHHHGDAPVVGLANIPVKAMIAARERQLVLAGTGSTHRRLLQRLAQRPLAGLRVTLLAHPGPLALPHRVAGIITGEAAAPDDSEKIASLAARGGVRVLSQRAMALDTAVHALVLDNGDQLAYDILSLDPDGIQDRSRLDAAMPGVREHGLFLLPVDTFATLWPRVAGLPAPRRHSIVVVGGGVLATDTAFAVRQRLAQSAITIVSGAGGFLQGEPERLQSAVRRALQRDTITLLEDHAVNLRSGWIQLGCGAELACDVPLIADEPGWPEWLLHSDLALNAERTDVPADACLRASGQSDVFIAPRDAGATVTRNLYANLSRMARGQSPRGVGAVHAGLRLASLGRRRAVAAWRSWGTQGYVAWRWKQWLERGIDDCSL